MVRFDVAGGRAAGLAPGATRALVVLAALLASGCASHRAHHAAQGHWRPHWPWHHAPGLPEPPARELEALPGSAGGASLEQRWDRNTLVVSLAGLSGSGELVLRPLAGHGWPLRMQFLVQPGSFAHLELRGDARAILAVPEGGTTAVLDMPLGLLSPTTAQLALRYGP